MDIKLAMNALKTILAALLITLLFAAPLQAKMPDNLTSMTEAGITYHYPKPFQPAVDKMRADLTDDIQKLQKNLGVPNLAPVDVWVVKRIPDYFTWHEIPNRAPEWAVGLSLSNQKTVLILNGAGKGGAPVDLVDTLQHELAHVAVDVAAGYKRMPRWFHEGYAIKHAEEWDAERSDVLSKGAAMGTLQPFADLTNSFPPHQQSVSLAYAQSYHFVNHIQKEFGDEIFAEILADVRRGKSFDTAFKHQTGHSVAVVEAKWKSGLESNVSIWAVFADEMILFFGASLLFLVAFGVRRHRTSKKLASMAMDEAGDGWDYDESRYPLPGEN